MQGGKGFDGLKDLKMIPETGSAPANFSSGGRGVLQTKDSSAESYLVAQESVIATKGSVTCDSAGRSLPVSWFGKINPLALDNQGRYMLGMDTFMSSAEDFTNTKSVCPELEGSSVS
ncbi:hypothetical protein Tco_0277089 [Tanacetum coccineum]